MFRTVKVDPDTSKLLEQYNVNFKGEIESRFLAILLSWVVPVFLFFGLWYFLMKRMAGQQPGFMTLGKNKAKIYMQADIDVRSEDVVEEHQELIQMAKDGGDRGFAELRESTIFSLIKLKAKEIEKIEEAIQKIDNGKYGRCRDCSRWIRPARLQVQPYAVRCRSCQEKLEKIKQI